jgi:hypothetical protein
MSRHLEIGASVLAAVLLLGAGSGLPGEHPKPDGNEGRPLIPVFSSAMDGPQFTLDYTNDTDTAQDLTELMGASSILLDGVEHRRQVIKFVGNANLPSGRTHSFQVDLGSYMPRDGWQKHGYSKKLKRWRWKGPLESGRHTLSVKLGNKQYGPITFYWDDQLPLLYE